MSDAQSKLNQSKWTISENLDKLLEDLHPCLFCLSARRGEWFIKHVEGSKTTSRVVPRSTSGWEVLLLSPLFDDPTQSESVPLWTVIQSEKLPKKCSLDSSNYSLVVKTDCVEDVTEVWVPQSRDGAGRAPLLLPEPEVCSGGAGAA